MANTIKTASGGTSLFRARDLREEINHFKRSNAGVRSSVTSLRTGAFEGLLHGICRKNSEDNRYTRVERHALDSTCDSVADMVVV